VMNLVGFGSRSRSRQRKNCSRLWKRANGTFPRWAGGMVGTGTPYDAGL